MRAVSSPPNASKLFQDVVDNAPEKIRAIISIGLDFPDGTYPHWDKIKRKQPPNGLTPELYWTGVKMAREQAKRVVPLFQKDGSKFSFTEPSCVRANISAIDTQAAGAISTRGHDLNQSDQERYYARSLIEEPFSSSVMEGAATTREVAKKLIEENVQPRTKDERMVLNNYLAMRFVKEHKNEALTPELILEIHRIISDGTLENQENCGVLRTEEHNVRVEDELTGEVYHFPPESSKLIQRLQQICDFANMPNDSVNFVHPIIKAIVLHFMIGYDHPFVDGNGRTARALFYWYAIKSGYWLLEYVSISKTIMKSPTNYSKAYLKTEYDSGDLTYFIIHQLDVLIIAIDELYEYAEMRKKKLSEFAKTLHGESINYRQSFVLNEAARGRLRGIKIAQHQSQNRVSYLTARKDLEELVEAGYFRKRKVGRVSMYVPIIGLVEKLSNPAAK
tara:strand:- start:190 stop:1533 length:1344 start_codon:yes stop_codon:yes gene_type:complete